MTTRPTVLVIIIGDEILKGQTLDTNSHFLCKELYKCGVKVSRISVVPDDIDIIAEEVCTNVDKNSFVITAGGIGPTHDDVTYEGIAKAFNEKLLLNKDLQKVLTSLCLDMGMDESAARKMSLVPESSEIHYIYTKQKKVSFPVVSVRNVFIFGGIPSYLEFTFNELKSLFCGNSVRYFSKFIYVDSNEFGIIEVLNDAAKEYEGMVKIGSYPDVKNDYYQVKITLEADSEDFVTAAEAFLRSHLPHNAVVGKSPPSSQDTLALLDATFLKKSETYDPSFAKTVESSLKVLKECYEKYPLSNVCVSFNGGKDCTALLHLTFLYLVKKFPNRTEKLKILYIRSKQPFSEIEEFIQLCVQRYNLDLISYSNLTIKEALMKLKEDHPEIKAILLGSRNTDPRCESLKAFQITDNDWPQFMRVSPLISWTYSQVWKFIRTLEVPYCSLYDRGMPFSVSSKDITLGEIRQVINSLGNIASNILSPHALALIISNSGEVTFTNNGWKVLNETSSSSPLAKLIINSAKNYTNDCGEDCKYFLFILQEFMHSVCSDVEKDDRFMRIELIRELSAIKQSLPVVFDKIKNSQEVCVTDSYSFVADLQRIVTSFMHSRFSRYISDNLTALICDFVCGVQGGRNSLKDSLRYIGSNFDYFCSKVFDNISESRVLKGFVIAKKSALSDFCVENAKFIIVHDMSLKPINDVSLKINTESFMESLNLGKCYEELFQYFVKNGIKLILTPSIINHHISVLCKANKIYFLDRLENEEIEQILSCVCITPLENLSDPAESRHFGEILSAKVFHYSNSCFINIQCSNPAGLLDIHHILLAAPFEALWKEYYFECLNCLKVIENWVGDDPTSKINSQSNLSETGHSEPLSSAMVKLSLTNDPDSNVKFDVESKIDQETPIETPAPIIALSLPPINWELLFLSFLSEESKNMNFNGRGVTQKLCLVINKVICQKMDVPFCSVKSLEETYAAFSARTLRTKSFLEPVICKEKLLLCFVDLLTQLLKIEKVLSAK